MKHISTSLLVAHAINGHFPSCIYSVNPIPAISQNPSTRVTDTLPDQNCVVMETNSSYATVKKSPESDRCRRKQKKNKASEEPWPKPADDANKNNDPNHVAEQFEIEYLPEKGELDEEEGMDEEFRRIFTKFSFSDFAGSKDTGMKKADSDTGSEEEDGVKEKGISNKKKKLQRRMKIAELKRICSRPDVVEVWDATASDPKLLVFLKSCRNTVPVPRHWSRKRKFLQGKIGIEIEPFQLPEFVAATGIEKVRLKQKQREPSKLGRMEIDYKVLHDAFFKYQRKPKLSSVGEVYHEGKEFEVKLREMKLKAGVLSHELKEALGMPEGDELTPPWLINMQRYGPPPSYPNYEEESVDNTKHWGDLKEEEEREEEEEEEMEEEELEVIELRKQQRKELEWPLYQVVL